MARSNMKILGSINQCELCDFLNLQLLRQPVDLIVMNDLTQAGRIELSLLLCKISYFRTVIEPKFIKDHLGFSICANNNKNSGTLLELK